MKITPKLTLFFVFSLSVNFLLSQSLEQKLDSILFTQFSPSAPGASVLVAKKGKVIYRKSIGMANLELDLAMKPEQVFRIGSLTKQFTAAAVINLVDENKISLADDIRQYVPDFLPSEASISIENLLTHTSGIKNYTQIETWDEAVKSTDLSPLELINIFKDEPLAFQPGEQFMYSNLGYILLGHIVESVSGISFGEYLEKTFFDPLNMSQTSYDETKKIVANRVPGYSKKNGNYFNAEYLDMKLPHAAGGLISNVDDILIWYKSIFENQIIDSERLKEAHRPFKLNNGHLIPYGYGWRIGTINGENSIKHDGIINGFVTFVVYLPEQQIFVALFSNCDCSTDIEEPASKMAAIVLEKPYNINPVNLSKKDLIGYQGIYKSPEGAEKHIIYQDDRLMYYSKGGSKVPLLPLGENHFNVGESLAFMAFSSDEEIGDQSFILNTLELPEKWLRISDDVTAVESMPMKNKTIEKFLGKYEFPGAFTFEVTRDGDKIYGQVGTDKKEIRPYGQNKFYALDIDARLIFDLEASGEVNGLTLIQNMEMKAKKIE